MRGLCLICVAAVLWSGCVRVAAYERGYLSEPRTSDSDLARFWAHEWGVNVASIGYGYNF
jgi:hypothetical protein